MSFVDISGFVRELPQAIKTWSNDVKFPTHFASLGVVQRVVANRGDGSQSMLGRRHHILGAPDVVRFNIHTDLRGLLDVYRRSTRQL